MAYSFDLITDLIAWRSDFKEIFIGYKNIEFLSADQIFGISNKTCWVLKFKIKETPEYIIKIFVTDFIAVFGRIFLQPSEKIITLDDEVPEIVRNLMLFNLDLFS